MSREIKFRAWDKEEEEMHEQPTFLMRADILKEVSTPLNVFMDTRFTMWDINREFLKSGLIFMQYTGLKDKNGKEIYEGDILKWTDPSFKELKKEYKIIKVLDITKVSPMGKQDETYLEVIGNIYESPELVK